MGRFSPTEEVVPDDWNRMITINATVPFLAIRAFLPAMKAAKRGRGTEVGLSVISPGRVDTYFNGKAPGKRPNALQPSDVADVVLSIIRLPARCQITSVEMESVLE